MTIHVHRDNINDERGENLKPDRLNLTEQFDSLNFSNEVYEGGKNYGIDDLDKDISRFFDNENVSQIQIITEIVDPETGIHSYISKVLDPEDYERINELGMSIYDYFDEEMGDDERYSGCNYVTGGVSVRVMY